MKKFLVIFTSILLFVSGTSAQAESHGPLLFKDGSAFWEIIEKDPGTFSSNSAIAAAADDLDRVLKKLAGISGEKTLQASPGRIIKIHVGVDTALNEGETALKYQSDGLYITGGSPVAVQHAVYYFLQSQFDVHWFWPGEDGEYIQPRKEGKINPDLNIRVKPSIQYRGFHMCGDWFRVEDFKTWMVRNFINIHRHGTNFPKDLRFIQMYSSHNVHLPRTYFETNPEYFAEINGKRFYSQLCMSHPEVDTLVYRNFKAMLSKYPNLQILSVFPPDNQEYCRCKKCAEKDVSTAWFDFYNRLTDKLKLDYPQLKFATIAYQGYIQVPKNKVRNSEFVEYASYPRCNIHLYGDPECSRNKNVIQAMKDWQATGVKVGDYAYEFDIFIGARQPFLPFYSFIANTVKKTVDMEQILLIPEIGLSPRNGPELEADQYQNRLGLYLYAQLMFNADRDMDQLIRQWCDCVYGDAADAMNEYFHLLDRRWSEMNIHFGILGSARRVAPNLMTPEIRQKAFGLLQKAKSALKGKANPALDFEIQLFNQWMAFLEPDTEWMIPYFKTLEECNNILNNRKKNIDKDIAAAWTPDALVFYGLKDKFELELSAGLGGDTWYFSNHKAWRKNSVGVTDQHWQPVRSYDPEKGTLVIPFSSLEQQAKADDRWYLRIQTNHKNLPGKDRDPAAIRFCANSDTGKSVLWWTGTIDRDQGRHAGIAADFKKLGWFCKFAGGADEYQKDNPNDYDIYVLRNPSWHANPFPEQAWEFLRQKVYHDGAVLLVGAYTSYPLERYLNDPTFRLSIHGIGSIQLSQRVVRYLHPGNWTQYPHQLHRSISKSIVPAYFLKPVNPEYWRILATAPQNGQDNAPENPFLMARPYGKGTVIVLALEPGFNLIPLIANIQACRNELFKDLPLPKEDNKK